MSDIEVTSVCEDGYTVENEIDGEWSLVVDALSGDGPSANQVLAADYVSCYIPALRVAASEHGYDDIGRVEAEVEAELDEDDDLESMTWTLFVEADLGNDGQDVVELGEEICHVHSALREGLHADVTLEDDAF
ncbi:MAG: OsmC family protein [Halosimplex sp.]